MMTHTLALDRDDPFVTHDVTAATAIMPGRCAQASGLSRTAPPGAA